MTEDADISETPGSTPADAEKAAPTRRKRTPKAAPVEGEGGPAAEDGLAAAAPASAAPEPDGGADGQTAVPAKAPRKRKPSAAAAQVSSGDAEPSTEAAGARTERPVERSEAQPAGESAERSARSAASETAPPAGDTPSQQSPDGEPGSAVDGNSEQSAAGSESGEGGSARGRRRRKDRGGRGERNPRGPESGASFADAAAPVGDDDDDDDDLVSDQVRAVPADPTELFAQVISGEYDEGSGEAPEPPPPHKRVLLPEPDAPKLQKVLAQSGIGSRRDMETLIEEGEVSVNGETAHIGQRISFGDRIAVRGKPVRVRIVPPPPRILAYHKPAGEVVSHDDPQSRPTVFRRLPRLQQGKWQSVGRLDLNTEGLLLFTNSGELANQLMHPRFGVEREYAVRVLGQLDDMDRAQLLEGVNIDGQTASFRSIEDGGGEGANRWYRVVITEGRNREVRKLFDAVELTVSRLIRIRYGNFVLPRGLKRGVWVDLDQADVRAIRQLAGGSRNEARPAGQAPNARQQEPRGRNKGRGNDRGNERVNERGERQQPNQQARGPQGGGQQNGPRQGPRQAPRDDYPSAPPADLDRGDDDLDDDFDPARIPNPLEQTFDRRFVQGARNSGGRGFGQGGGGFGPGGSAPGRSNSAPRKPGAPREPDPLQTSVGYIGADALHRKNRGGGGGGGGGNRGGGGFGGNRGGGGGGGGKRGR